MEFRNGTYPPAGREDRQPEGWPPPLICPASTLDFSLAPNQPAWRLPPIPTFSLSSTYAAYSGAIPRGQPWSFSDARVNGYSPSLHRIEGDSAPQIPPNDAQYAYQSPSGSCSSTASAAFTQQFGAVDAHGLSSDGHSQKDIALFSPRRTHHHAPKTHRQPVQRKIRHKDTTEQPGTVLVYRKTHRPAAEFTSNLRELQARCLVDGGERKAVDVLPKVFYEGISQSALLRPLTRSEAHQHTDGASGQAYRMFLRVDEASRFRCRLCVVDSDESGWKHARDALRHLKRDHFGLGDPCGKCGKLVYSAAEMTKHRCQ